MYYALKYALKICRGMFSAEEQVENQLNMLWDQECPKMCILYNVTYLCKEKYIISPRWCPSGFWVGQEQCLEGGHMQWGPPAAAHQHTAQPARGLTWALPPEPESQPGSDAPLPGTRRWGQRRLRRPEIHEEDLWRIHVEIPLSPEGLQLWYPNPEDLNVATELQRKGW